MLEYAGIVHRMCRMFIMMNYGRNYEAWHQCYLWQYLVHDYCAVPL